MNILLLYGGKSCEHDISIITASITQNGLKEIGKVYSVYANPKNEWWLLNRVLSPIQTKKYYKKYGKRVFLTTGDNTLKTVNRFGFTKSIAKIDVAVPCFHGLNGEDGSISGLLQLSDIPYTCGNTYACGAGMDKIATKTVLKGINAKVLPCVIAKHTKDYVAIKAAKKIGFPLIVKPSNLGSSIGIKIAQNETELELSLQTAFAFDDRVLIERALTDFYEVNCSAIRNQNKVETGDIERPVQKDQILSFADKYGDGGKQHSDRIFPYHFDGEDYIKLWTKKIYNAFNFEGVIRVDYLVDNTTGQIYVNEVNAIPGSLAYYLWQNKYSQTQLLQILISQAQQKQKQRQTLTYAYNSDVLSFSSVKKLSDTK